MAYDFAAWHATDAVRRHHSSPDTALIGAYIVRRDGQALEVAFGGMKPARDTFFVEYTSRQDSIHAPLVSRAIVPPRPDTGYYLRAARALLLAKTDFGPQDRPYDAAVIPADSGTWWVYRYPAATRVNVWPLGGDVRYRISPDGRTILAKRLLHRSIRESSAWDSSAGRAATVGMHTAVVDNVPEDTDVLLVLQRRPAIPEYVATVPAGFIYIIDVDGSISYGGQVDKSDRKH